MRRGISLGLVAGAGLLSLSGCIPAGPTRTESKEIEIGSAESVRTVVRMSAGSLNVSGGAKKLAEANFHYSSRVWRPHVRYDETGSRGRLTIEETGRSGFQTGNVENDWTVRLNDEVPMDLEVKLGAGDSRLDLAGMSLRNLEVDMGAGQLNLDLRGNWNRDFDVRIRGGVGEATVRLPVRVGVIVEARGGLGGISARGLKRRGDSYVNDAYRESKTTLRVDIKGGIGQINLIAES